MLYWTSKDPDEVLDYALDWSARLAGDTIATSVWSVATGDIDIDESQTVDDRAVVWLSAGTNGKNAILINTITTSGGRTMEESVTLPVISK